MSRATAMTGFRRRAGLGAGAVLAGLLLAGGLAAPAQAHSVELGTSPERDSTVTEPIDQISVTFNENVLQLGTEGSSSSIIRVVGPDGRFYETSCGTSDSTVMTGAVALGGAGVYTASYRVVSADGHPISAEFAFTYEPAEGAEAAEGSAAPVCQDDGTVAVAEESTGDPADPSAGETSEPVPTETDDPVMTTQGEPAERDDSGMLIALLAGGGAALVVAALVSYLVLRKRPGQASESDAGPEAGPTEDAASASGRSPDGGDD